MTRKKPKDRNLWAFFVFRLFHKTLNIPCPNISYIHCSQEVLSHIIFVYLTLLFLTAT